MAVKAMYNHDKLTGEPDVGAQPWSQMLCVAKRVVCPHSMHGPCAGQPGGSLHGAVFITQIGDSGFGYMPSESDV